MLKMSLVKTEVFKLKNTYQVNTALSIFTIKNQVYYAFFRAICERTLGYRFLIKNNKELKIEKLIINFKIYIMKMSIQLTPLKQAIIASIIAILLLFATNKLRAQTVINKVTFETTPEYVVKQFSANHIQNKFYFKFLILENREGADYVLESSSNGVDFNEVATKEGVKSPNNQPLLYCYIVNDIAISDRIFRVRITSNKEVTYSNLLDFSFATDQTLVKK